MSFTKLLIRPARQLERVLSVSWSFNFRLKRGITLALFKIANSVLMLWLLSKASRRGLQPGLYVSIKLSSTDVGTAGASVTFAVAATAGVSEGADVAQL
jgi:hypothetical protein